MQPFSNSMQALWRTKMQQQLLYRGVWQCSGSALLIAVISSMVKGVIPNHKHFGSRSIKQVG